MTKIYNPNIFSWQDIKNWSAPLQIKSVLLSIQSLLNEPNIEEEVNVNYKSNRAQGEKTEKEWT